MELKQAFFILRHGSSKGLPEYLKAVKTIEENCVPVVRCRDCKYFADNNDGEWLGCQMFNAIRIVPEDAPKPDDYCSYGERKDGGADDA